MDQIQPLFALDTVGPDNASVAADFVDVLLNLSIDHPFTYRVPEALREILKPGMRVRVPFRKGWLVGYVSRFCGPPDVKVLKEVQAVLDVEPLIDERMFQLARWIADTTLCSWGEALDGLIPSGVKKKRPGKTVRMISPVRSAVEMEVLLRAVTSAKQRRILELLMDAKVPLHDRELLRRAGAMRPSLRRLIEQGILREQRIPVASDDLEGIVIEPVKEIILTVEQERSLSLIGEALECRRSEVILLHGVTGSGKTEVYIRAIERVVASGRQAIVLVPEIALTPQTVGRFKSRFPSIAVLHSMLSESDRAREWRRIREGGADVVIGARSAVFAPTRSLGMIVIDEEHETAYKQESVPRYHAREVAIRRAQLEGAVVVLGTATPSLESFYRVAIGGFKEAALPYRVLHRRMPEIEVVDLCAEAADLRRYPVLSRKLLTAVRQALDRREQILLFLNRRGFTTYIQCSRCGWVFRCRRCTVGLTYHRQENQAMCHYCYETARVPPQCPECRVSTLRQLGIGTERIEEEVEKCFQGARVARMDSDSMKSRHSYREALGGFWRGETDILIGTQMIAKGMDVPNVTLVGVISADTGFHLPDFRGAERAFQLITQVAGRAGRGPKGGRVIVQTFNPRHYAIVFAARYDLKGFAAKELEMRRELSYPPFSRLVRLVLQGTCEEEVRHRAERIAVTLRCRLEGDVARVLGPSPAPIARLRGKYRYHLLVKALQFEEVLRRLRSIMGELSLPRAVQLIVDVDPNSVL